MPARVLTLFDPLVRLLLLAIVLASVLPVTGEGRAIARLVSDAAIFALFLLNGLRLPRAQVLHGLRNWRFLLPLALFVFAAMGLAGWLLAGPAAARPARQLWRWASSFSASCLPRYNRRQPTPRLPEGTSPIRWWRRPCSTFSACSSPRR